MAIRLISLKNKGCCEAQKNIMFHSGFLRHCKEIKEKFKISKENRGDKLVITFAGDKKDVENLDKKIDAAHTLMEDCCCDADGKPCC